MDSSKNAGNSDKLSTLCKVAADSPAELRLEFSGDLTIQTVAPVWKQCTVLMKTSRSKILTVDAEHIASCDGAGIGLLSYLLYTAGQKKKKAEIIHLRADLQQLLERFTQPVIQEPPSLPKPLNVIQDVGKFATDLIEDIHEQIAFLGRVLETGLRVFLQPWKFRWNDFYHIAEYAGVRAIGIVSLLGFLFGLIMSFSSAMPLRQFGVEVYVSDLVAYAMVRVLGPILTAIIVAGRTGSSYAAELGTMKINNEIDALKVMNLDPVAFLVLPRVLATTLMTPLLTIAANIWGLLGSAIVILSLGYPVVTYTSHVQSMLSVPDVLVGLVKAVVYGTMIGMVGCLRGLQTKIGAGAVGFSTTRAVVTAIVLLVTIEGIFSVLLHFLDI